MRTTPKTVVKMVRTRLYLNTTELVKVVGLRNNQKNDETVVFSSQEAKHSRKS